VAWRGCHFGSVLGFLRWRTRNPPRYSFLRRAFSKSEFFCLCMQNAPTPISRSTGRHRPTTHARPHLHSLFHRSAVRLPQHSVYLFKCVYIFCSDSTMASGVLTDKIFKLPPPSAEDSSAATPQKGDSNNPPSEMPNESSLQNGDSSSSNALESLNLEATPPLDSGNAHAPLVDSLCNQLRCDVQVCNIPTPNGTTRPWPVLEVKRKCVKMVLILHLEERVPLSVLSVAWDRLCALTNPPELHGPQPWRLTLKFVRDCADGKNPRWKQQQRQRQQQKRQQQQSQQRQQVQHPHNTFFRYFVNLLHGEVLPRATNIISVVYDVRMCFYQYTTARPSQSSIHWVLECMEEKNGFLSRVNRDDALMNPHTGLLPSPARVTNGPVVDTPGASNLARAQSMDQTAMVPRDDDRDSDNDSDDDSDDDSDSAIDAELASNKPATTSAEFLQPTSLLQLKVPPTAEAAGASTVLPTKRKCRPPRPYSPEPCSTQPTKRNKLLDKGAGTRIYGKWPFRESPGWKWGIITKVSRNATGRQAFSIRFDDGHVVHDHGPSDFMTAAEFQQTPTVQLGNCNLVDLRRDACGTCVLCVREDCAVCWTCRDTTPTQGGDGGEITPVCLRKVRLLKLSLFLFFGP
jgi:hypothetical protein